MATFNTRELSKQLEKHKPPKRTRKKNEENEELQILFALGEFQNTAAWEEKCYASATDHLLMLNLLTGQ
jgi:hypothetical protein